MMKRDNKPLAMCPFGAQGRAFAHVMEWMNRAAYRSALNTLSPGPGDALHEIGFGTGAFLLGASERMQRGTISGADPSELMVAMAARKLSKVSDSITIELRQGDDTCLPAGRMLDHVVAIHSFQFWTDPHFTLRGILDALTESGRLMLVLREHGTTPPDWLPNPISCSGDEVNRTGETLARLGYVGVETAFVQKHSTGILAFKAGRAS